MCKEIYTKRDSGIYEIKYQAKSRSIVPRIYIDQDTLRMKSRISIYLESIQLFKIEKETQNPSSTNYRDFIYVVQKNKK